MDGLEIVVSFMTTSVCGRQAGSQSIPLVLLVGIEFEINCFAHVFHIHVHTHAHMHSQPRRQIQMHNQVGFIFPKKKQNIYLFVTLIEFG